MELFFDIQPGWLRLSRHLTTRGIARTVHTVGLAIHWAGIHESATAHGNLDPIRLGSNAQLPNGDPDLPFTYTTLGLHAIHYFRVIKRAPGRSRFAARSHLKRKKGCGTSFTKGHVCAAESSKSRNICQSCLQSAGKGPQRRVLSFCCCVRTRSADVNIFFSPEAALSTTSMQIENVMSRAGALLARIAIFASFSLESDSNVFNDTLEAWLTDPSFQLRNGSTVGLCCSSVLSLQFPEQPLCDDGLTTEFRRFLLAKSLAHSGWLGGKVGVSHAAPRGAGHVSGYRLLKRLDRTLTSQFLAQFDRESCQILFLMVLGTVLSVGGGSPPPASEESPACPPEIFNPTFQKSPTLWLAMKEHLSQMLAHHLIFLGSMLGIRLETGFEQRIIDTAVHQWNNAGIFVWGNAAGLSRHGHSLPYGMPLRLQGESHRSFGQPLPTAGPCIEPLTPIPCPELAHFQPSAVERWSDNPQSYLEMTDEPEDFSSPSEYATSPVLVGKIEAPRSNSDPFPSRGSTQPKTHEVQRRTIWVVRSFDGGSEHGNVKVHARLRGNRNVNDFAAFV